MWRKALKTSGEPGERNATARARKRTIPEYGEEVEGERRVQRQCQWPGKS